MKRLLLALAALSAPLLAMAEGFPPAEPLYAATLWDTQDQSAPMGKYRGRPLVVNFWARWCTPCREEIPDFIKVRNAYKARGVELLGIGIEDNAESVRDFAKAYDMDYPLVLARSKGLWLMQVLGNTRAGLPFTVVIDRRGNVVARKVGPMKKAEMEAAFQQALK